MSASQSVAAGGSSPSVSEAVRRLVAELHPSRIYLFGSQAYGAPHAESDVDMLIVMPTDPPPVVELSQRGYAALRTFDLPIELHFWGEATFDRWATVPASLPHIVKSRGRLLYAA